MKIEDYKQTTEFLQTLLKKMKLDLTVMPRLAGEAVVYSISGEQVSSIIGHRGEDLNALQIIVNASLPRSLKLIRLDVEKATDEDKSYREKREHTLRNLAKSIAAKVIQTGRPVALEPMSAIERKIIHETLQHNKQVKTVSRGKEPNRFLEVTPGKVKSKEGRESQNNAQENKKNNREINKGNDFFLPKSLGDLELKDKRNDKPVSKHTHGNKEPSKTNNTQSAFLIKYLPKRQTSKLILEDKFKITARYPDDDIKENIKELPNRYTRDKGAFRE